MLYHIKFYIKYLFYIVFLLALCLALYQIALLQEALSFKVLDYKVFTSQNVFFFCILGALYFIFKVFRIVFSINNFFISLKYKVADKIEIFKSHFNIKQKTEDAIVKEILHFKRKGLYKMGLRLTAENLAFSSKILFWHLFFLLKLGKKKEFLKAFLSHPAGNCIRVFKICYLNKKLPFFRGMFVRELYFKNLDNQIITYIYADYLFSKNKIEKAETILMNFIKNKKILMSDVYCSFLMNSLAIKIEKAFNGEKAEDFILEYKENIDTYNEKKKK
jgi:hypothetical protein